MQKNVASQKWVVFAFEDEGGSNPGEPVTSDAANITANLYLDGSASANAVDDTNPTELGAGYYVFDITAAESNAENIVIAPASSSSNVNVIGVPGAVYTTPSNFPDLGVETDGDLSKVNALDGHTAQTGDTFAALPSNFADLSITSSTGRVDVASIEGSDATDQIRDAVVDDATRIDASALNTAAGAIGSDGTGLTEAGGDGDHLTEAGGDGDHLTEAGGTGDQFSGLPEVSADVVKVSGDSTAADNLEASLETMLVGTATGGSTTTVETSLTGHGDDTFINRYMLMRTGTLQYEGAKITDYDSTSGTFTFAASSWTTGATNETFVIV